jgi:hypothetical protein
MLRHPQVVGLVLSVGTLQAFLIAFDSKARTYNHFETKLKKVWPGYFYPL